MKKTKKILLSLLAALSVLGGSLGLAACDGLQVLEYALLKDGTYEVVNCFGGATQIVIPSSYKGKAVTSIGEGGLNNCSSLTSIEIPDSVTSIGKSAFDGCKSLASIDIPDKVVSIGESAFNACESLTSVDIPESVISIGDFAFNACESLASIEIPDSVTSIGANAFSNCNILQFNEYNNVKYLPSKTNGYFALIEMKNKDSQSYTIHGDTKVIAGSAFNKCSSLKSVEMGNSVTSIGKSAFNGCESLTSINIPDSVTSIGKSAFNGCESLTSINIPDGVTSIDDSAFNGCKSLTSATVGGGVTYIGKNAFSKCEKLTSIEIPDSVTSIGESAFNGCKSLTSATIGNNVTSIGASAFNRCHSLTSATIGSSVTSIGDDAFKGCYKLVEVVNKSTHITVGKGNTDNGGVASYALAVYNSGDTFTSTKLSSDNGYIVYTDIVYIDGKEKIEKILVAYTGTETDVALPTDITQINRYAFSECTGLTSVVVSTGVTAIGEFAFNGCDSLTSATIGNSVISIGKSAFNECDSLTSATIGSSVTSIGTNAFKGCYKLVEVVNKSTHITIGKGKTNNGGVGAYALAVYNSGDEFTGTKLSNDNGYIVYTDEAEKILVAYTGTETNLTLPTNITKINEFAFSNYESLTSIAIPESVTSIGDDAFKGCCRLVEVVNKSTHIMVGKGDDDNGGVGSYALAVYNSEDTFTSTKLSSDNGYIVYTDIVYIGEEEKIEKILVDYRGTETDVTLPTNITKINQYAFSNYESLTSVVISNGVTAIGKNTFANCKNLTSIAFNGTMEEWKKIMKGSGWDYQIPATKVVCSDGEVSL